MLKLFILNEHDFRNFTFVQFYQKFYKKFNLETDAKTNLKILLQYFYSKL